MDSEGVSFAVASDEEALNLPSGDAPRVVITGLNCGHYEDLRGLEMVSAMRRKWPQLCALYLAAVWPAHLRRRKLAAGERFLTKPVQLAQMTGTVHELLDSDLCGGQNSALCLSGSAAGHRVCLRRAARTLRNHGRAAGRGRCSVLPGQKRSGSGRDG